ncbi:MAG: hypothetical protein H7Z13_09130 [Ferruginibacter sp.]|nr:hypothetical protein [Ferruginibacter sp.]
MKNVTGCLFTLLMLFNSCINLEQQNAGRTNGNVINYQLVKDWPQLPDGYTLGNPTGIGIDSNQHIFIFHRAGRKWPLLMPMPRSFITAKTVVMLDRQSGKIINSWGEGLFIMPHGLTVDQHNNIWVTDVGLHQVFKFSHEGALLMKLGEATVAGSDAAHFNLPTDIAVAGDGSFYVSDGYGNSRVVKFSSSGKYLFEWGKKGSQPGEFNIPHAIDLDEKGNVYVADRENSRVQAFDTEGNFLKEWKNKSFGKIYSITISKIKQQLVAVDYSANYLRPKGSDVMVFDSLANLLSRFGRSAPAARDRICRYHDVAIDNEENIYVGDIYGNTIQKFTKVLR